MVSNILPLRLAVHPRMTVSDLIAQAAEQIRAGLEHQRFQISDLRREVGEIDDDGPLFGLNLNIMRFDYDFRFAGCRAEARNLSLGPVEDLSIQVYDRRDGGPIRIDFDANPARHSEADVADHQQRFLRLLTALAEPDRAIGTLDMLAAEERHTILRTWNETGAARPACPQSNGQPCRRVRGAGASNARRNCAGVRGGEPQLSRARRARQPACPSSAIARRRTRDHRGPLRRALARHAHRDARPS